MTVDPEIDRQEHGREQGLQDDRLDVRDAAAGRRDDGLDRLLVEDGAQHQRRRQATHELGHDIADRVQGVDAPVGQRRDGDRGVEVAPRDDAREVDGCE